MSEDGRQRSDVRGQMSEDRGRMSEDRCQRTEGKEEGKKIRRLEGQRVEDGRQRTDVRDQRTPRLNPFQVLLSKQFNWAGRTDVRGQMSEDRRARKR